MIALAYLPINDVITGFDLVAADFDDDGDDLLDYFEKTWIGEPKRRGKSDLKEKKIKTKFIVGAGRKKPIFDHSLWNVYDRVIADLPRSNNSVEGWHKAFATRVTVAHPTIKKLTEKIIREQSRFEVDIAQILQGRQPKPRKACYIKLDERISKLVREYSPSKIPEYLHSIAANVYF